MSLNWNISKIKNYKQVCWDDWDEENDSGTISSRTETIIFMAMFVDMGKITEENWEKFYQRVNAWEQIEGAMMYKSGENGIERVFLTPEDIYSHIGLSCNVATTTDAKFKTKLYNIMMEKADDAISRFKRTLEVSV